MKLLKPARRWFTSIAGARATQRLYERLAAGAGRHGCRRRLTAIEPARMNYRRYYLNMPRSMTRASRSIPEKVLSQEEIFGAFLTRHVAEQCAGELGEHRA